MQPVSLIFMVTFNWEKEMVILSAISFVETLPVSENRGARVE